MSLTLANSLTQVMWGFVEVLLVGNFIIGIVEGAIIAAVFHARPLKAIGWMLAANFLSAALAGFVFGIGEWPTPLVEWCFDEPLYHAGEVAWVCIAVGIAMTLIIEWPFCYLALREAPHAIARSLKALLLVHAVSLTCLLGFFWPVSHNTLGRDVTVVRRFDPGRAVPNGWVYYVNRDTGDVHRIRLDGSADERVLPTGVDPHHAILFVKPKPWHDEVESYEVQLVTGLSMNPPEQVIERFDAAARIVPFMSSTPAHPMTDPAGAGWTLSFGMATADLRDATDRSWQAFARHNEGLVIERGHSDPPLRVIFDTPFDTWRTHSVTALPGDLAVFDFGLQVCLLDVRTSEITLLARGVGPVIVLDGPNDDSQP